MTFQSPTILWQWQHTRTDRKPKVGWHWWHSWSVSVSLISIAEVKTIANKNFEIRAFASFISYLIEIVLFCDKMPQASFTGIYGLWMDEIVTLYSIRYHSRTSINYNIKYFQYSSSVNSCCFIGNFKLKMFTCYYST